jgi:hypothetical protein
LKRHECGLVFGMGDVGILLARALWQAPAKDGPALC